MIKNAEGKQEEVVSDCVNPESCEEMEIEAIEPPMKRQRVSLNKYNLRNTRKQQKAVCTDNLLKIKEF